MFPISEKSIKKGKGRTCRQIGGSEIIRGERPASLIKAAPAPSKKRGGENSTFIPPGKEKAHRGSCRRKEEQKVSEGGGEGKRRVSRYCREKGKPWERGSFSSGRFLGKRNRTENYLSRNSHGGAERGVGEKTWPPPSKKRARYD